MGTHASAGRNWTPEEIAELTVEKGYRLRGLEVTRLDTFVDATFAFVLTLLVISFDEIPQDFAAMTTAIKGIPAFGVSFAILMMFWLQHRAWSRRYGIENTRTLLLSLALIFAVLVYVFPMRAVIAGMFSQLSGGWLPAGISIDSWDDLRGLFLFYSSGFVAMCGIMWLLLQEALRAADALRLDDRERLTSRTDRDTWAICVFVGLASIAMSWTLPDPWVPLAGHFYWLLALAIPFLEARRGRLLRQLEAEA